MPFVQPTKGDHPSGPGAMHVGPLLQDPMKVPGAQLRHGGHHVTAVPHAVGTGVMGARGSYNGAVPVGPTFTSTGGARIGGATPIRGSFSGGNMIAEPVAGGGMPMGPLGTFTNVSGQNAPRGTFVMGGDGTPIGGVVGAIPMGGIRGGVLKAGSITDDVFNMVDRNQDGVISRSEFIGALKGNIINASQNTRAAL